MATTITPEITRTFLRRLVEGLSVLSFDGEPALSSARLIVSFSSGCMVCVSFSFGITLLLDIVRNSCVLLRVHEPARVLRSCGCRGWVCIDRWRGREPGRPGQVQPCRSPLQRHVIWA